MTRALLGPVLVGLVYLIGLGCLVLAVRHEFKKLKAAQRRGFALWQAAERDAANRVDKQRLRQRRAQ